jgi:hypothetical protein
MKEGRSGSPHSPTAMGAAGDIATDVTDSIKSSQRNC